MYDILLHSMCVCGGGGVHGARSTAYMVYRVIQEHVHKQPLIGPWWW